MMRDGEVQREMLVAGRNGFRGVVRMTRSKSSGWQCSACRYVHTRSRRSMSAAISLQRPGHTGLPIGLPFRYSRRAAANSLGIGWIASLRFLL